MAETDGLASPLRRRKAVFLSSRDRSIGRFSRYPNCSPMQSIRVRDFSMVEYSRKGSARDHRARASRARDSMAVKSSGAR